VRQHVYERLADVGDVCEAPRTSGAFYCLLRVRTSASAMLVAERLVREHRVAVIPGTAFGLADGCHLRVSFGALDAATVEEGVDRLARGLRAIV
jgi:aspartate/methionine/tyrosine aminotransferase